MPAATVIKKIDKQLCQGEKFVAGTLFIFMSVVMFAAVIADIFARDEGRLSLLAIKVCNWFGAGIDVHSKTMHHDVSPWLNLATTVLLVFAGFRTMVRPTPYTRVQALGRAAVLTVVLAAALWLLRKMFPNGVVWGADAALACMLWVGFLGASIATHDKRHLALEMGEKIWPKAIARYVRALAMLATAAMCLLLLYLSWKSLTAHYADWHMDKLKGNPVRTAERLSGSNTNIPVWTVFLIFPYTFVVMALRFVGIAVASATGTESPPEERIG